MKQIYFNGKVYKGNGEFCTAFIVEDGIFTKTGTDEEILINKTDCELIDLKGKTVLAGINDSHAHLLNIAKTYREVYLLGVSSIDEIIKEGKQFLIDNPHAKILNGRGWNSDFFTSGEIRNLTRDDLDSISTEIPIVFRRVCGHMLTANSKAIEISGITEDTIIEGGSFDYKKGQFFENAGNPLLDIIEEPNEKEMVCILKKAMEKCKSVGITTMQTNDCTNSGEKNAVLNAYKTVFETQSHPIRVRHQINFSNTDDFAKFLQNKRKLPIFNTDMQDIGPMKLFKDGSLGARSALVKKEYADSKGNTGIAVMSDKQTEHYIKFAHENNLQVVTHVIGNKALNDMVVAYSKYTGEENPLRWGLIHTQLSDNDDIEIMKKYNIATLVQPIFLRADIPSVKNAVDKQLQSTSYAFGSMIKNNIHMSFGTDAPIDSVNPFENIYWAVARKYVGSSDVFFENECVSVEDAIDAYTIESAYIEFKENYKGKIEKGYLADFIIIDKDIFTIPIDEIPTINVLSTYIDGKKAFERNK